MAGIKGMKWGIRRYQNSDGTLTDAGKKRYYSENDTSKGGTTTPADPRRWANEDDKKAKESVDLAKKFTDAASAESKKRNPKAYKERLKLDHMSNEELQSYVNREKLERQYNELFAKEVQPQISAGKRALDTTLEVAGPILTATSTALSIAIAVRTLKGQMQ